MLQNSGRSIKINVSYMNKDKKLKFEPSIGKEDTYVVRKEKECLVKCKYLNNMND